MRLSSNYSKNLYKGLVVYNVYGDKLIVKNYNITYTSEKIDSAEVFCTNEKGLTEKYSLDELYDDFNDLCDEEKSFIYWIRKNTDIIYLDVNTIDLLRKCYVQAFANGFNSKLKYSAQEILQK
jgi:hypothetical protein